MYWSQYYYVCCWLFDICTTLYFCPWSSKQCIPITYQGVEINVSKHWYNVLNIWQSITLHHIDDFELKINVQVHNRNDFFHHIYVLCILGSACLVFRSLWIYKWNQYYSNLTSKDYFIGTSTWKTHVRLCPINIWFNSAMFLIDTSEIMNDNFQIL